MTGPSSSSDAQEAAAHAALRMSAHTERVQVAGPAGTIECSIDRPAEGEPVGVAVLCHPHPVYGGTMDNKVVQTLARAFLQMGWRTVRFNFRGVGGSAGAWDEGRGEVDDAMAVIAAHREPGRPLVLGGFSFGSYVASQAAARLPEGDKPQRKVFVGTAVVNFPVLAPPADTLVVHGEQDDVVPLAAVFDWARPLSLPVVVIPGVGHFFHGQLGVLKSLVVSAWASSPPQVPTGARERDAP